MHAVYIAYILRGNKKNKVHIMDNETDRIIFNINKRLKEEYKKAIKADRTTSGMTDDLIRYIDRKVKRSGILEKSED